MISKCVTVKSDDDVLLYSPTDGLFKKCKIVANRIGIRNFASINVPPTHIIYITLWVFGKAINRREYNTNGMGSIHDVEGSGLASIKSISDVVPSEEFFSRVGLLTLAIESLASASLEGKIRQRLIHRQYYFNRDPNKNGSTEIYTHI